VGGQQRPVPEGAAEWFDPFWAEPVGQRLRRAKLGRQRELDVQAPRGSQGSLGYDPGRRPGSGQLERQDAHVDHEHPSHFQGGSRKGQRADAERWFDGHLGRCPRQVEMLDVASQPRGVNGELRGAVQLPPMRFPRRVGEAEPKGSSLCPLGNMPCVAVATKIFPLG